MEKIQFSKKDGCQCKTGKEWKQKLCVHEKKKADTKLLKVDEIDSDSKCKAGEKLIIEAKSFKCKERDVQNTPSTKSAAAGIGYSDKKYKVEAKCDENWKPCGYCGERHKMGFQELFSFWQNLQKLRNEKSYCKGL